MTRCSDHMTWYRYHMTENLHDPQHINTMEKSHDDGRKSHDIGKRSCDFSNRSCGIGSTLIM